MEKCINYECEGFDEESENKCNEFVLVKNCTSATIKEFAEISVDKLAEMLEKIDRQNKFIDFIISHGELPEPRDVLEDYFNEEK